MSTDDEEHTAMVEKALDAIPGYPFLPCPICQGVEGCDHTVPERAQAFQPCLHCSGHGMVGKPLDDDPGARCENCNGTGRAVVETRDVDNTDVVIQGMAEMAERFTARMDAAAAQIDELQECLILCVKELELPPNAPTATLYTKGILIRARKALGLQ